MLTSGASDTVIQNYKNYGKVQAGDIPSKAPITHQHRIREKGAAPAPKDVAFHGFSKPAAQVRVMMKD